mmetsp:Transcript_18650/g.36283  ORF Transcript_18650/g.36283 Transcript_18650/m.36283 type:complete len:175 (+) Transcript_18650:327-851(+)
MRQFKMWWRDFKKRKVDEYLKAEEGAEQFFDLKEIWTNDTVIFAEKWEGDSGKATITDLGFFAETHEVKPFPIIRCHRIQSQGAAATSSLRCAFAQVFQMPDIVDIIASHLRKVSVPSPLYITWKQKHGAIAVYNAEISDKDADQAKWFHVDGADKKSFKRPRVVYDEWAAWGF